MRYELAQGKRIHSVELKAIGANRHRVRWTLRSEDGEVIEERELEIEAREVGEGCWSVLVGHDVVDARVERAGARRTVELPDGAVELEYLDPLRPHVTAGASASGPQVVTTPIPGRVVRIPVKVGDVVAEGQAVIVVEAMKMANELRSPIAGTVSALRVAQGAAVEAHAPLVVIDPVPS